MTGRRVTFPGSGGTTLNGRLELPPGDAPLACALFAHCFTCSKDLNAVVRIARALTMEGIAVLRFDFTGLGESEGDFAASNFSSNVEDLVAAAEFLQDEQGVPAVLIGHSLGGAATIRAAGRIPAAVAVATIGAPFDPAHAAGLFATSEEEIDRVGEAEVVLAGRSFTVRRQLLEDLRQSQIRDSLESLGRPLLVFHSPLDQTVGIENAASIYTAARHPKSFVSLDDADHLLTRESDACYVGEVLAAWLSRYLPRAEPPDVEALVAKAQVATRTRAGAVRTEVMAASHGLVADEPVAVGGNDEGPTPYDLLLAALGACTGMTLRMYAERKGLELGTVDVHLRHGKLHADDERRCEGEDARLDRIERWVELHGELDPEQRERLLEIADRCPVHRTLSAGVVVETHPAGTTPDGVG
ncbi:MAG: bifunctional alpha/beta hydrolase/OsmC family protein [Longimicrobiaceae bacterium]